MKKLILILLVLILSVSSMCGFLNIKTSAVMVVDDVAVGGAVLGMLGSFFGIPINSPQMEQIGIDYLNMNALKNGEIVTVYKSESDDTYKFKVSDTVNQDQRQLAETLSNKLNEKNVAGTLAQGFINNYSDTELPGAKISARQYIATKNDIVNAVYDTMLEVSKDEALQVLADNGVMQKYNFDFVGPIQGYTIPSLSGSYQTVVKDGYELSVPFCIANTDCTFGTEPQTLCGLPVSNCYGSEGAYEPYLEINESKGCYGFGYYIVYNNEIYYNQATSVSETIYTHPAVALGGITTLSNISQFYTCDGKCLANEIEGVSNIVGNYAGLYFFESPDVTGRPENVINASDLIGQGIEGFIMSPDLTDPERIIKEAQMAGILPEEFPIGFNEKGEIVSVNGINLVTIQDLLSKLTTDQIKFSDIQSYLECIKIACEGTDATVDQIASMLAAVERNMVTPDMINTAIEGIKELETANAEKLTNIENYLKIISGSIAISETTEIPKGFEIDTPDIITDKFPFSLPFDIYRTFNLLSANPVAPQIHFPIKMEGLFDLSIDIDFSEYNWLAEVIRWFLFIIFVVGLILETNKLIGRG